MTRTFLNGKVTLHGGDCRDVLKSIPDASIDSVVTDPPYALVSIQKRFGKPGSAAVKVPEGGSGAYARASAGFMGKQWDTGETAFCDQFWSEVLRVLKPGGHVAAFSGTRTYHRLAVAIEDAGFEIRDQIGWAYGSGFSKVGLLKNRASEAFCDCKSKTEHDLRSMQRGNVSTSKRDEEECCKILQPCVSEQGVSQHGASRAELEAGGVEQPGLEGREIRGTRQGLCDGEDANSPPGAAKRLRLRAHSSGGEDVGASADGNGRSSSYQSQSSGQPTGESQSVFRPPGTLDDGTLCRRGVCSRCGKLETESFGGFGGSLKPAWEPICLARKPLIGTVATNVLEHGTGALNIDGCRVGYRESRERNRHASIGFGGSDAQGRVQGRVQDGGLGRWPANLIHDGSDEVLALFPESKDGTAGSRSGVGEIGMVPKGYDRKWGGYGGEGSAARFFYTAKADSSDRLGSKHPTVKPIDLMQWLCRLITPPGGTVLDPFAGTGTTGEAAWREGMRAILIEREDEYQADIARRMELAENPSKRAAVAATKNQIDDLGPLFAGLSEAAE
jgi:DNA modification methylase